MNTNDKGFGLAVILLVLTIVGVIGFGGWYVYDTNVSSRHVDYASDMIHKKALDKQPTGEDELSCENNGIIIVMFNDDVSSQRQNEIIELEKASVNREYDNFNGYALKVPIGQEEQAVDSFSQYAEVKSSGLNSCDTTNEATQ